MKLNINDTIRVRLTDLGRKTLAVLRTAFNEQVAERFPGVETRLPLAVEEKDGWSEWQLWVLMETFGEFCGNGMPLMFETEIEIPEPPPAPGWEPFSSDTVESAQAWAAGRWYRRANGPLQQAPEGRERAPAEFQGNQDWRIEWERGWIYEDQKTRAP